LVRRDEKKNPDEFRYLIGKRTRNCEGNIAGFRRSSRKSVALKRVLEDRTRGACSATGKNLGAPKEGKKKGVRVFALKIRILDEGAEKISPLIQGFRFKTRSFELTDERTRKKNTGPIPSRGLVERSTEIKGRVLKKGKK